MGRVAAGVQEQRLGPARPLHDRVDLPFGAVFVLTPLDEQDRNFDPGQQGSAANIIPGTATLAGTLRALSAEVMDGIYGRLEQLCRGVAEATGCTVVCRRLMSVPPCVNAPGPSEVAARACAQVLGSDKVIREMKPLSFTDDFAHFLDAVPGAYLFLGQDGPMCHNPEYDFDDALLPVAGSIFVAIVEDRLGLSQALQLV